MYRDDIVSGKIKLRERGWKWVPKLRRWELQKFGVLVIAGDMNAALRITVEKHDPDADEDEDEDEDEI